MSNKTIKILQISWVIIVGTILTLFVSALFSKCNRPVKSVEPVTKTDQIISAYNPIIDSLAKQNYNLKYENDSLKTVVKKLSQKRSQIKEAIAKEQVVTAIDESNEDTVALVISLKKQAADCAEYVRTTDRELSEQAAIIKNNETMISNQYAQIDLFKKQVKKAAEENSSLFAQVKTYEKQLPVEKQRKKNWRRVAGGAIAVAIIEGFILTLK